LEKRSAGIQYTGEPVWWIHTARQAVCLLGESLSCSCLACPGLVLSLHAAGTVCWGGSSTSARPLVFTRIGRLPGRLLPPPANQQEGGQLACDVSTHSLWTQLSTLTHNILLPCREVTGADLETLTTAATAAAATHCCCRHALSAAASTHSLLLPVLTRCCCRHVVFNVDRNAARPIVCPAGTGCFRGVIPAVSQDLLRGHSMAA
jgi:hypothetical protein